jgi:hypothetical protein
VVVVVVVVGGGGVVVVVVVRGVVVVDRGGTRHDRMADCTRSTYSWGFVRARRGSIARILVSMHWAGAGADRTAVFSGTACAPVANPTANNVDTDAAASTPATA